MRFQRRQRSVAEEAGEGLLISVVVLPMPEIADVTGVRDMGELASIQVVRADVHGDDQVALDVKGHAQIGFYVHRVDRATKASG
jgi:hypothetical protein